MKRITTTLLLLGVFGGVTTPAAAASMGCDRQCLKSMMDTYVDALAHHDPSKLPLSKQVRFTENGAEIGFDEGLWATFNRFEDYRHDLMEPATGGIASYFYITENHLIPFPDLLMVRLKVVNRRITQIETVVDRHARAAGNMSHVDPAWTQTMDRIEPPATRLTREQLIKGAIGYMRAIAFHDGKQAPFAESCIRLENGNVTATGPHDKSPVPMGGGPPISKDAVPGLPAPPPPPDLMGLGCGAQADFLAYSFITGFEDAHFPVVDVDRQVVFATFDFMRRGDVESWTYKGATYPMIEAMRYPNEILNTEFFKFVDGKISRVEAVFEGPQAYRRGTGWPGGTKPVSRPKP